MSDSINTITLTRTKGDDVKTVNINKVYKYLICNGENYYKRKWEYICIQCRCFMKNNA